MSSRNLYILCYLLALCLTVLAQKPTLNPPPEIPEEGPPPSGLDCQTIRSQDYYGLGVRLGVYFAWCTSYIANNLLPGEVSGALDTNFIFLTSLFISMARCTMTGMLTDVDGLVLIQLSNGTMYGVLSIWGYRTCHYQREGVKGIHNFGGFGTHVRLILCVAVCAYSVWYWQVGLPADNGLPMHAFPECQQVRTFLFTNIAAAGHVRYFYMLVNCVSILLYGVMLLTSSIAGYKRLMKMTEYTKKQQWALSTRLKYETGFNMGEYDGFYCLLVMRRLTVPHRLRWIYKFARIFNLFWII